jgi:hypothetical protein
VTISNTPTRIEEHVTPIRPTPTIRRDEFATL